MNHLNALFNYEEFIKNVANGTIENPQQEAKRIIENCNCPAIYRENDAKLATKHLIDELFDAINMDQFNEDQFEFSLKNKHRTLQQDFTRLIIMKWIDIMADNEYYDARNEASVRIAKKLRNAVENANIYIPRI